jgi:tripartite-type tricarboxylate transporter receptor subunit TctC
MLKRELICSLVAAAATFTFSPLIHAEQFPSRAITMIVPFTPGGLTDVVMRMAGAKISESVGQPFIVDNRPSGAGTIGALAVKQAAPDGYTLFFGHAGTHAVNPSIMKEVTYDPVTDFRPITNLITATHFLVVPFDSPAKTVADLVTMSKTKPGGLSFASQGIGTGGHVTGEMFRARAGANFVHVPYRGGAPAATDTAAGRVDFFFSSYLTVRAMIDDKRLRVLAVTSDKRSPVLPNVPTMAEAGFPGVELDFWYGVFAPAKTPDSVVRKLNAEFRAAMKMPEVTKYVTDQVAEVATGTPEDFAALIAKDSVRLGTLMKATGAKLE